MPAGITSFDETGRVLEEPPESSDIRRKFPSTREAKADGTAIEGNPESVDQALNAEHT